MLDTSHDRSEVLTFADMVKIADRTLRDPSKMHLCAISIHSFSLQVIGIIRDAMYFSCVNKCILTSRRWIYGLKPEVWGKLGPDRLDTTSRGVACPWAGSIHKGVVFVVFFFFEHCINFL